jgi:hypothetical protein
MSAPGTNNTAKLTKTGINGDVDVSEYLASSAYTRLEYIESTGTQYINTRIMPSLNLEIESELAFMDKSTTAALLGTTTAGSGKNITAIFAVSGVSSSFGPSTAYAALYSYITLDTKTKFKEDKNGIYLNDTRRAEFNANTEFTGVSSMLFLWARGTNANKIKAKVYSFKIYDNGTLVQDLVPARRNSNNIVGMYDLVSGQFFTNAGTGEFVAGPVIDGE